MQCKISLCRNRIWQFSLCAAFGYDQTFPKLSHLDRVMGAVERRHAEARPLCAPPVPGQSLVYYTGGYLSAGAKTDIVVPWIAFNRTACTLEEWL